MLGTLREIVARAKDMSRAQLAAELGPLVLIGPRPDEAAQPTTFQYTTEHSRRSVPSPIEQLLDGVVYRIAKRADGRMTDVVLIGRASSNDVVVEDTSISKLHARITIEPSGALRITDARSTNGTFVDGRQLGDGESVVLRPGAELRLGDVALRAHDTRTLLDIASRFHVVPA